MLLGRLGRCGAGREEREGYTYVFSGFLSRSLCGGEVAGEAPGCFDAFFAGSSHWVRKVRVLRRIEASEVIELVNKGMDRRKDDSNSMCGVSHCGKYLGSEEEGAYQMATYLPKSMRNIELLLCEQMQQENTDLV